MILIENDYFKEKLMTKLLSVDFTRFDIGELISEK
jgi:hypothetical protein